jgi:hypothetical protein
MSEQMKRTVILFVSLLGVTLIVLVFIYAGNKAVLAPEELQNNAVRNSQKQVALPKPTGKVEDAVGAATAGVANEDNLLKEEELSAGSVVNDSSEVSSFDQSYDEKEL